MEVSFLDCKKLSAVTYRTVCSGIDYTKKAEEGATLDNNLYCENSLLHGFQSEKFGQKNLKVPIVFFESFLPPVVTQSFLWMDTGKNPMQFAQYHLTPFSAVS